MYISTEFENNVEFYLLRDITDRKKGEDEIKRTLKELNMKKEELEKYSKNLESAYNNIDGFAHSISHDLRTPLRAICSYSQILMELYDHDLNDQISHYLHRIYDGSCKMDHLINDLLNLSRIDKIKLELKELDVDKIVDEVISSEKKLNPNRNIKFIVNSLCGIVADYNFFNKIFYNLIDNAVKFTDKNEEAVIEIGCEETPDFINYFVKDNGVGFDVRFKDNLFKEFQKLHPESEFIGSGMGLATVKKLVIKLGGKVWADGEIGKGATFTFSIPKSLEK